MLTYRGKHLPPRDRWVSARKAALWAGLTFIYVNLAAAMFLLDKAI